MGVYIGEEFIGPKLFQVEALPVNFYNTANGDDAYNIHLTQGSTGWRP